jgi:hypothetical protein|tara:strand:- start:149 stop:556 length:408 start_codon:yes stop_codon:yes gene_type:complete
MGNKELLKLVEQFEKSGLMGMKYYSSPLRRKVKGSITEWDCGDLIIRTDIKELKQILDDRLIDGDGLSLMERNTLQNKYGVPTIVGGMWKKDNWNVYKDDFKKPYEERGEYELESNGEPTIKTKEDILFIEREGK